MTGLQVGTLVRVLVNIDLLDGCSVNKGDVGIIISDDIDLGEIFYSKFDYALLINGCEIYVFYDEVEKYINEKELL